MSFLGSTDSRWTRVHLGTSKICIFILENNDWNSNGPSMFIRKLHSHKYIIIYSNLAHFVCQGVPFSKHISILLYDAKLLKYL